MSVQLLHGDCLALLPTLAAQSVDLVLSDWPYGTTACAWDSVIPLDKLWPEIKRVLKPRGAVVLTASQPFTSALVMSNPKWFRYEWVWIKSNGGGFFNVHRAPLKRHESVLVFSAMGGSAYEPQMQIGAPYRCKSASIGDALGPPDKAGWQTINNGQRYPTSVLEYPNDMGLHPTQKPLALFEYLMRTYSNPGDVVLDNAFGSCTTGEAAIRLQRAFIGMEKEAPYFAIGAARCAAAQAAYQPALLEVR